MARLLFGGSSDDYVVDTAGRPVANRRIRFYTDATRATEITDLASDAAGTGSPLTVLSDTHGFWPAVYGPDAVSVMYAGAVDSSGNPPAYVVAVYTHTQTGGGGGGAGVSSFNTRAGAVTLAKSDVTGTGLAKADLGLGNVDNTADTAKPVSTAQAAADTAVQTAAAADVTSRAALKANNLSDLANAATARTNLGLGSAATQSSTAFDAAGAATAVQTNLTAEVARAQNAEAAITNGLKNTQAAVAATSNQALTGLPTVDGVTLTGGQVILLTGQTAGSQNGLWAVASGAWARPAFFAAGSDATGTNCWVESGTVNGSSSWVVTGTTNNVVGTNVLTWQQASGLGEVTVTSDLTKTGNQFGMAATTVTPGSYVAASFTVDSKGRITAASNGASVLSALTDTAIVSPADAQILTYEGASSKWKNKPAALPAPQTGYNPVTGYFQVIGYGAKADAVTLSDGAMTSGSAAFTSTAATFTSADIGKVVVVNNALGAGVHLYTTISAFTDAHHVTLAANATATISGTIFTYGTDDTTAIQAAITAAQAVHGVVLLPPSPSIITAALNVTDSVTIAGLGATPLAGSNITTGPDIAAMSTPQVAPYLAGSVLVVAAANVHALNITATGRTVDLRTLGIYFAGMFKTTGHGIYSNPAALSTYKDNGLIDFKFENVYVLGHDSTHYAAWLTNPLYGTITHLHSWGGGGLCLEANSSIGNYGNMVITHLYHEMLFSSAATHGIYTKQTLGVMNLLQFNRPQVINGSVYVGTHYSAWGSATVAGNGIKDDGATNVAMIAADIEGGLNMALASGAKWFISPDSLIPATLGDPITVAFVTRYGARTTYQDGTKFLSSAESAGSVLALLNDNPQGAIWGITTDGTVRLQAPGVIKATGKTVTTAVGAGLGTTPPPVVPLGTDLAGRAIFGSGTTPAAGAVATVTFARTQAAAPNVLLTANNAATQALGLYVSASSTTSFTVSAANAPAAAQAVSTYDFSWLTIDAGGAPTAPVVYESFDKTDSATSVGSPQIGSAPTANLGTWGVSGNLGYLATNGGGNNQNTLTWDSGKSDCTIQATLSTVASTNAGLTFRNNGTAFFYAVNSQLWFFNGTTWTQQGSNFTQTFVNGDTMKIVLLGTAITIYRNGTQVWTGTSSTNQTVTKHGLYVSNAGTAARFDNFQVA